MPTPSSFLPATATPLLGQLPLRERPAERLYAVGPGALSLTELLAAIIGGPRQLETAQTLITQWGDTLPQVEQAELERVPGVGRQTAARLKAALELGQRLAYQQPTDRYQIRAPQDAANILIPLIGHQEQEHFVVLYLDTRNQVLDREVLYKGTINTTIVRIAEVFRGAIRRQCASIMVAHNHPSGNPEPSPDDVLLTRRLYETGKTLEVELLDHIIVGGNRFVSLRDRGIGFG
jgi:DNA repair protein RadC